MQLYIKTPQQKQGRGSSKGHGKFYTRKNGKLNQRYQLEKRNPCKSSNTSLHFKHNHFVNVFYQNVKKIILKFCTNR